jgi:hypothetical protein
LVCEIHLFDGNFKVGSQIDCDINRSRGSASVKSVNDVF